MLRTPAVAPAPAPLFAEPTPLGLIGLAIGCAALTPIAFGYELTPAGLRTAAVFCLLFGAGCQFLAGMMSFANKNLYGGTLFTAFAFSWAFNYWVLDALAHGAAPAHGIVLATEVLSLVLFVVFTYGFGFHSKLLFAFLLDIDLLYACKLLNAVTHSHSFDLGIAAATVLLAVIALWIAFAILINPTAGRAVFPLPGPLFTPRPPAAPATPPLVDLSLRTAIADALYAHWRVHGFAPLPVAELEQTVAATAGDRALGPDLQYLHELGGVALDHAGAAGAAAARLTAAGIDCYEQSALHLPPAAAAH